MSLWDEVRLFSCFGRRRTAQDKERAAILAYIVDRTYSWPNDDLVLLRKVLDGIDRGDHREACAHGEYDDLFQRDLVRA